MKQHKHLIIRAKVRHPIEDVEWANHFLSRLIAAIDMEVLIPPQAAYCEDVDNEGVTAFTVITTSHIALHVWHKDYIAQLDVYSCKDFNPDEVYKLLDEFMSVEQISSAIILRDTEVVAEKINLYS